jgi:protease PrsW
MDVHRSAVPPPPAGGGWGPPVPPEARPRRRLLPVAAVLLGLAGLALAAQAISEFGALGAGWVFLLATLPAPLLVAFVRAIDRYEPEPPRLMVAAFAWGATAAVFLAGIFNAVGWLAAATVAGEEAGMVFVASVVAPVGEEILKAAALGLIWWRHRGEINGVVDGIVYAALVGMGFAVVEDAFYYGQAWLAGGGELAATVVVRGLLSPFAHSMFTALTGIGIAWSIESARLRWFPALAGLAGAIFLHAAWNTAALVGLLPLLYLFFFIPLFVALLVVARLAMRHEGNLLRRHLQPEVARGLLSPGWVEVFASIPARRRLLRDVARSGGPAAQARTAAVLHAAAEAAFARHRAERLADEAALAKARHRTAELHRLLAA